jgi:D-sedoheptulose 7-phosphate isomerase
MKDQTALRIPANQHAMILLQITESVRTKQNLSHQQIDDVYRAAMLIIDALRMGNKVLIFGNGGSAADAQHFAAELVGRFRRERRALAAIALSTDTSILTSIGNDYGFEDIFVRQISALGKKGDIAIGISTSGNSPNVLKGMKLAQQAGLTTISLTGRDGGALTEVSTICIQMPSLHTARIQECSIMIIHILCDLVENAVCEGLI